MTENYPLLPDDIRDALDDYAAHGHEHGGFVMACLRNEFVEAVCRADSGNLAVILDIARYIYNELPGPCWGSPAKVEAWRKLKVVAHA
mgnify:CR=1 FL=1